MRRSLLWPLFAIAGCNAVLGISDDPSLAPGSASCLRNSDCADDQVCLFEVCSAPCMQDRDCPSEERCLQTDGGSACVKSGVAACSADQPCPTGSVCSDGTCRNACQGDGDCLEDQTCDVTGVCRGTDPSRDPVGGSGSGGSGGEGAAGGAPSGGGAGGDASVGGGPAVDEPCGEEGAVACAGSVSAARLRCEDGVWAGHDPCVDGELCDASTAGECKPIPEVCEGRTPGESFCVGAVRTLCSDDLLSVEQTTCNSVQLCSYGSGANCAACLPEEHHCSGDFLQVCNPENTGFMDVEECTDEPCNADAGACTSLACLDPGAISCLDGDLYECAQDQMSLDLYEDCGVEGCTGNQCLACSADSCLDEDTRLDCAEDQLSQDEVECGGDTPYCTGSGLCVECTDQSQCEQKDCYTVACSVNTRQCTYTFKGTGQTCSTGVCSPETGGSGTSTCVGCVNADDCPAPPTCYEAVCGQQQTCGTAPLDAGDPCSGGVCNGSGSCVECIAGDQCDGTDVCHSSMCVDAVHYEGNRSALGTDFAASPNTLYLFRMEALDYDAQITALGVWGKTAGTFAKLAVYLDNGAATPQPTGTRVAETNGTIGLSDGASELGVLPSNATLSAGQIYWIGIEFNAATTMRTAANASTIGRRYSHTFGTALPTLSTAGTGQSGADWAVYIKLQDLE